MFECPYHQDFEKKRASENFPCKEYINSSGQLACGGVLDKSNELYWCLFPPKREFIQDDSMLLKEVPELIREKGIPKDFPELFKKYGSLNIAKFEIGYLLSLPLKQLKAVKEKAKNKISTEKNIREVLTVAGSRFAVNTVIEGLEEKITKISNEVFGYTIKELLHPDRSYLEIVNPTLYKELNIKNGVEKIRLEKERVLRYIKSESLKKYKELVMLQKNLNEALEQDAWDEANEEEELALVRKVFESYLEKSSKKV